MITWDWTEVGSWQQGYNDAIFGQGDKSDELPITEYRDYQDGYFEGSCDKLINEIPEQYREQDDEWLA